MSRKEIFACSNELKSLNGGGNGADREAGGIEIGGAAEGIKEKALYQLDFVNTLADRDYEKNLGALRAFKFYDPDFHSGRDAKHPSPEEVKSLIKGEMTPSQADFVRMMGKPVFQLVPVTNYDRYTDVYTNFRSLAETGWVRQAWDNYDGNKDRNSWASIKGWEVAITDDMDFPLDDDEPEGSLEDRIKWFDQKYGKAGLQGMDFRRFLMLAMMKTTPGTELKGNRGGTHTLLNGVPMYKGLVAAGTLDEGEGFVHLREANPELAVGNVVFKPSLVFKTGR